MTAVSINTVDAALLLRYTGVSIDTGEPAVPTAVEVFIEEPASEEYTERTYPSISLKLMNIRFDETRAHSDDDTEEETAYDDLQTPPVRTMRLKPTPYILFYSLDTWHKIRVGESRDLVSRTIMERTPPRGAISVEDVDGGTETCWMQWSGVVSNLDEELEDYVIYHKSLLLEVYADLLTDPTERDVKVATDLLWDMYCRKHVLDETGRDIETSSGDEVLYNRMRITETSVSGE